MTEKLIRDVLGSPIPQLKNEDGTFTVLSNGDTTGVNFSKKKLLRDALGSPLPLQYYDVETGQFVAGSLAGDSAEVFQMVNNLDAKFSAQLAQKANIIDNANDDSLHSYALTKDYPDKIHDMTPVFELSAGYSAVMSKDYGRRWRNKPYGLKLQINSSVVGDLRYVFDSPKNIPGVQAVGMWFYVDNPEHFNSVSIEIGHQPTNHQWVRQVTDIKKGWNLFRHVASNGNVGDWTTFYRLRVRASTKAATTITIGSIWLEQPQKAKLLFVQDGGYSEFYNRGYQQLKSLGVPVTWALNPGRLGVGRMITESDVDTLAQDHMSSFSFHSWASEVHSTMTKEQVADNAIKCMRWLQKKGLRPDYLYRAAITQNSCPNHAILQDMVEAYATPAGESGFELFPFSKPFGTPRIALHGRTKEVIDNYFDTLKKTRCLMIGYTHGIGESSTPGQGQLSTDMTQAEWDYFISKVQTGISEGWLEGVTYEQLRRRYSSDNTWGLNTLREIT